MVAQRIEFITENREDFVSLEKLLGKTLPQLGFERKGPYGMIGNKKPIDFSTDFYIDPKGNEVVYNYRLERKGVYSAFIDATKVKADIYSSICELVNASFPNLFKRRRVGA